MHRPPAEEPIDGHRAPRSIRTSIRTRIRRDGRTRVLNGIDSKADGYYQYVEVDQKTGRKRRVGSSYSSSKSGSKFGSKSDPGSGHDADEDLGVRPFSTWEPSSGGGDADHTTASDGDWIEERPLDEQPARAADPQSDPRSDGEPLFGRRQG